MKAPETFSEKVDADRRLVILRLLVESEGYANEAVLEHAMIEIGHRVAMDRDVIRRLLRDLEEAALINIRMFRDKVMVASITVAGVAVAEGRRRVDGVAKPSIGV